MLEPGDERLVVWEELLRTVNGLLRTLEQELRVAMDLPLTWFDVMVHLNRAPDRRLRMQVLAQQVILSRSGLTRLVDRMEAAGLVRREPSEEDRRGYYCQLTPAGVDLFERAKVIHLAGVEEHFSNLIKPGELRTLHTTLSKLEGANQPGHRTTERVPAAAE